MSEELPALSTSADGPECDLCGRTDCPDADLPEFSEPVACALTPAYVALRYDRCEYGCGRDITKASIREAVRALAAALSTPPTEGTTEWGVRHSQGIRECRSERDAREWLVVSMERYEANFRNKVRPVIVTRRVTEWTEVTP